MTSGELDKNFSRAQADIIEKTRGHENMMLSEMWKMPLKQVYITRNMVYRKHLYKSVIFEEEMGTVIPDRVTKFYNDILDSLNREDWPAMAQMLSMQAAMCVPLAFLKARMHPNATLVVGKLGFSSYDWEYGEHGVKWI